MDPMPTVRDGGRCELCIPAGQSQQSGEAERARIAHPSHGCQQHASRSLPDSVHFSVSYSVSVQRQPRLVMLQAAESRVGEKLPTRKASKLLATKL